MGGAHRRHLRLGFGIDQGIDLRRNLFGLAQRSGEGLGVAAAPVQRAQSALDNAQDRMAARVGLMQADGDVERGLQVVIELFRPLVADAELDPKAHQRPVEEGEGIDQERMGIARPRIALDHQFGVVAVQRLGDAAVEIGQALRVGGAGTVLPLAGEFEHQRLAGRRLGHDHLGGEPGMALLLGPDRMGPEFFPIAPVGGQRLPGAHIVAQHMPLEEGAGNGNEDLLGEVGAEPEQLSFHLEVIVQQAQPGRKGIGIGHPLTPTPAKPVFMFRRNKK